MKLEYVKVPVPEELVAEVTQFMQWNLTKMDVSSFDAADAARLLDELDEPGRRLVVRAAECSVETIVLTVPDAAELTGLSEREVIGFVIEFNDAVRRAGSIWVALATGMAHETTEQGPKAWTLSMPSELGELLLMAARRGVVAPE